MTIERRHLVQVDLTFVTPEGAPAEWPFDEEEYVYTCVLEGRGDFDLWAVRDGCVVLHRFGGSYGPAEFVVTPRTSTGAHSLLLTFVNEWGVPVSAHELKVEILASVETDTQDEERVLVGVAEESAPLPFDADATALASPDAAPVAVPLRVWYTVAGVRRSSSGDLYMDPVDLFFPGATRGDRATFTARCAQSDDRGTVFAVIAESRNGVRHGQELRSVQSAKVPPGIYQVTAELLYPDQAEVKFHGLPVEPREESRRWPEIVPTIPRRLSPGTGPIHLIAAIEISGSGDLVRERVDCVDRLFARVAAETSNFVCYSVVTYGPHAINEQQNPEYLEVPVTTLAWAGDADTAVAALGRPRRLPEPAGYEFAAQLECMLRALDSDLTGEEGRPVIVTVGGRPPHPPGIDPGTEIIPCRYRVNWNIPLSSLQARFVGIAFGSIRDNLTSDPLWKQLGSDVEATMADFSPPDFASALRLTEGPAELIPLPMFAAVSSAAPAPELGDG